MAFDRADTDVLYERRIRSVLERNGIVPVIINRRQSNDDLNTQIMEQLDASDLCIADLTYERPSVYYEAGFAQRTVPVIYTVRSDHVPPKTSPDGRVHFDLQMKPLIKWASPTDRTFAQRLEKRLRATFLRAWHRRVVASDRLEQGRREFANQALTERLGFLRAIAKNAFRRIGFGDWTYVRSQDQPLRIFDDNSGLIKGRRYRDGALVVVMLQAVDSLTKRRMESLYPHLSYMGFHNELARGESQDLPLTRMAVHTLVCALQPVNYVRLESVLHTLPRGDRPGHYVDRTELNERRLNGQERHVAAVASVDCLAPVRSEAEFRSELRALIPQMLNS